MKFGNLLRERVGDLPEYDTLFQCYKQLKKKLKGLQRPAGLEAEGDGETDISSSDCGSALCGVGSVSEGLVSRASSDSAGTRPCLSNLDTSAAFPTPTGSAGQNSRTYPNTYPSSPLCMSFAAVPPIVSRLSAAASPPCSSTSLSLKTCPLSLCCLALSNWGCSSVCGCLTSVPRSGPSVSPGASSFVALFYLPLASLVARSVLFVCDFACLLPSLLLTVLFLQRTLC